VKSFNIVRQWNQQFVAGTWKLASVHGLGLKIRKLQRSILVNVHNFLFTSLFFSNAKLISTSTQVFSNRSCHM